MVKMAIGAGTDSNANPGPKLRAGPATKVAPAMLSAPGLSGPGLVGATLRVDPGLWSGDPTPSVTLRWRRDGADVPGATGIEYVPVLADEGSDLRCVVTASNVAGSAGAVTETVRIVHVAPVATGAIADQVLDQDQGALTLDASAAFTGAALVFDAAGAGATVDPGTGLVSLPLGTPRAAETVTVTATNSGGSASVSFTVTVIAAPVLTPPVSTVAPSLSGPGRVGTPMLVDAGTWSGDPTPVLSPRWRRNGAEISGATEAEYTPVTADEGADLDCLVSATNVAGSAEAATGAVRIVHAAPVVEGPLADRVLDQGQGAVTLDASAAFTGAALVFDAAGAGAVIDPATGILTVPDDTPRVGETVTVTATNSGGSASVPFTVTVIAAVVDTTAPVLTAGAIDAAASPATLSVTTDEGGRAFWMVDGVATREAAEVEAGGGAASGAFDIGAGATARDVDLEVLAPGVWTLHLMIRDAAGNRSNVISSAFDLLPSDLTAPVLTPGALSFGATTAERPVGTDEGNGTLWRLVDGNASRTAAQVKAAGLSVPVTASGAQGAQTWTGLTAGTGYNFHLMHEDLAGNQSTVSSAAFTTNAVSAGLAVEQTVGPISDTVERASGYEYTGDITIGGASNRGVFAIVHGYNATSWASDATPGAVTISLGGSAMTQLVAPEIPPSARAWSAIYWIAAPTTGVRTLSIAVARIQRAMSVTLVEASNVHQTTPVAFTATTIQNGEGGTLGTVQDFPSRTLADAGNRLLAAIAIDNGTVGLPTASGGTMLLSGKTGTLATSDVTHGVALRDAGGVIGFQMSAASRAILQMIEVRAA